ncbi:MULTISPECIES: hypothetical protein [unclassified Caballeronia]|uniref:hypothetical protein n=1 Tax=unclassified Caballeronia TaxID=2646786 RepID=UPI00202947E4|nr:MULTISPECIES: hypothetical protein [unclassified Caballeronia]
MRVLQTFTVILTLQTYNSLQQKNARTISINITAAISARCSRQHRVHRLTGDGQALLGETTSTVVSKLDVAQVSFYSNTYTAQMFPTSYNGLFYLVAIQVDADIHGNDCEEIILGPLPPPPLETVLASPDDHHDSSCMQGIGWRFFTIFGVSPDFVKPSSAVSFHSNNGEHGKFRLSGATGDKDLRIVTISSINIMVGTLNP